MRRARKTWSEWGFVRWYLVRRVVFSMDFMYEQLFLNANIIFQNPSSGIFKLTVFFSMSALMKVHLHHDGPR